MVGKQFWKSKERWAPIVAIVIFFALSALYFAPQFGGKRLQMHDVTQYQGMSHDIKVHNQATGDNAAWTGNLFSGMPSYMIYYKYPGQILKSAASWMQGLVGDPTAMTFFAMLGFWLMLVLMGINPWVAIVGAVGYGFSTYSIIIIGAGHITKMWAMVYAPLLVGAVSYTLRGGNMWIGSGLAALTASVEIGFNHPQITYYFALIIAAAWINRLFITIRQKSWGDFAKRTAVLVAAAVLAVGSNFAPLYYTYSHTPDTTRAGSELGGGEQTERKGLDLDYATAWSYGRTESFNMFIPNLMGGSSEGGFKANGQVAKSLNPYNARKMATTLPAYWGDQPFTAGPTYIGAVLFFLAVMGLFVLDGRRKWWITGVSILALLLAWGSNLMWFTELAFKILPGYNKFRTVSMALVVVQWSIPLLAALSLNQIWRAELTKERLIGGVKWSAIICGGVALLFFLLGKMLFDFSASFDSQLPDDVVAAMQGERASMLRADALRSLLFVVAAAGVVLLFAADKIKRWMLILALGILVVVDLIPVDKRYLPWTKFTAATETTIQPTAADQQIMADKELGYRVANLAVSTFNDATTSYFHRSVGGYHGAKLQRYQDFIDRYLMKMDMNAYNLLNTKYFIVADEQSGQLSVQVNTEANGAAWFVEDVKWVNGADEEIEAVGSVNNKLTAVIDKKFESQLSGATLGNGEIYLSEYAPNRLVYNYSSEQGGLALFSEIYYAKGWQAYLDGAAVPHLRADYLLRAMELPAGDHTVEFRFEAPHNKQVSKVTLLFSLAILVWMAAALTTAIIKTKKNGKLGQ